MSSNDHKKFKTEATQKTSTDTEIISDAVLLPPYSTDHILTVTVGNEGTSSVPVTTTETLTRNYPAQNTMFYYSPGLSWWGTTDDVFKSYDFSNGVSLYYAGSQGYFHKIDRTNIFDISFTDGSYIKFAPGSNSNISIEYREGSAGTIKSFESPVGTWLQSLASQSSNDQTGGNEYEFSSNQVDTYIKYAASFGPSGYKITTAGDFDTTAQSLQNISLTANNGADWADLDFSSKTVSSTKLITTIGGNNRFRLDLLALGRGELNFPSLLCKYDSSDVVITGGTDAIEDAFSKDYDRFFLFGNGDSDNTAITSNNGSNPPRYPTADIDMKSHGDNAAVSLTLTAVDSNNNIINNINLWYKSRPDLPNWSNSAGSVDYEATTTTTGTGSNITGQVDVELEMSPDGENWCPAQTETITAGSGGTATGGVSAEDANLNAVSTLPDPNSATDTYKYTGNKFALGSKSYDDSGNEIDINTPNGGTKDFMHQLMSKDKPFNYSLWLKTKTDTQPFADDYTPVIFRHGGKDKFTNLKTVELTDNATQNLCTVLKNNYAVKVEDQSYAGTTNTINVTVANNGTSNKFYVDGVSVTGILRLAEGTTYIFDQSDSSNSGHPLRFSTTSDGTHGGGSEYTTGVTVVGTPGSAGAYTQIVIAASAPTLYTYCTVHAGMGGEIDTRAVLKRPGLTLSNASGTFINPFKKSTDSDPDTLPVIEETTFGTSTTEGIVISSNIRVTGGGGGGTNYNQKRLWTIYCEDSYGNPKGAFATIFSRANGNMYNIFFDENWNQIGYYGVGISSTVANGSWHHISCQFIKQPSGSSHNQGFYSRISLNGGAAAQGTSSTSGSFQDYGGLRISKVVLGEAEDYSLDIVYDNLCFYTGFLNTNTNTTDVYNARKNPLSFSSPNMELKSCFVMGDGADDRSNHIYKDIVEPSSGRQFVKNGSLAAPVSITLTSSDEPYAVLGNSLPNVFDTNLNGSISGWFKTTDTGTLFSNTGGAAATGLKVDITGTSPNTVITASYLDSSFSTSVTGAFNDGEWHHIVMALSPGSQLIVVDNTYSGADNHPLVNDDLRGDNGFTLLGDGQQNAGNPNPSTTDASKLQASLSNWSLHSEELNVAAISQLYSNGHVRNIKNLPAVNPNNIVSWWKLSDTTTPEEDSAGSNDLIYNKPVTEYASTRYVSSPSSTATGNPNAVELVGEQSWFPSLNTGGANTMPGLHDDWTISFWYGSSNANTSSQSSTIWSMTTTVTDAVQGTSFAGAGYHFYKDNLNNVRFMTRYPHPTLGGTVFIQTRLPQLTNGVWYHITLIKDAGWSTTSYPYRVYINGNSAALNPDGSFYGSPSPASTIFHNQTIDISGLFRNGHTGQSLGDIVTFNRALTGTEASDLYANHNKPSQVTAIANNIDTHFRMGDGPDDILGTNYRVYDVTDTTPTTYLQNSDTTLYPSPLNSYATSHPAYEAGTSISTAALSTYASDADGATKIVEEDQYGSGITMSLTKRFNTTTNEWTNVHTNETCVCLSFNGFEDQAEHFAIYTHDTIDVADNAWHNLALSFSGREGGATTSTTNFSFDTTSHNFVLSIDGSPITGAHFVGGLAGIPTGKSFTAQERYLKWDNNSEEDYIPHAQLNSNIFESINQTNQLHEPVKDRDYKTGFVGYADESSFHSESWFTDSSFNPQVGFNDQKVKTLYGSTGTTLSNRGAGSSFPAGTPYPLRRPSVIGSSTSTGNQYIDPDRYNASTNADGGLEAWWRWGDTTGDCSVNINDAIGYESGGTDTRRSLKLNGTYNSEENSVTGLLEDLFPLTSSDSIYVPEAAASSGGGGISLVNVIIENVQAGVCNLKNLTSPILQYIRVKFTNSGEAQLGEGKLEATVHYRKRRER